MTSGGTTNPDIECWTCGEKGHYKDKCPKKSKKKSSRNRGKSQEAYVSQPQDNYAFSFHPVGEALTWTTVDSMASSTTIYDSGATTHMSPNRDRFFDFRKIKPKGVKAVNKTVFMVTGIGCMKINMPNGKDTTAVVLQDILYCLDLGYTLISLAKCNTASFTVLLKDKSCCIKDSKGHQIGRIFQYHGLYCVDEEFSVHIATYRGVQVHTLNELHEKMGHILHAIVKHLIEQKIVLGLKLDTKSKPTFCTSCAKARPTWKPILKERVNYISHVLGDKIYLDVRGPAMPQSYKGKLYYVSFTDNYTRWMTIYCNSQKLEVLTKFKEYKAWV